MIIEGILVPNIDEIKDQPHGSVAEFVTYTRLWLNIFSTIVLYCLFFINRTNITNVFNDIAIMWSLLEKIEKITNDQEIFRKSSLKYS